MPGFVSPLADPASWSYSIADAVVVPAGLRYAGYQARGLRATRASPASVAVPALGVLRKAADAAGRTFVEVQVNPFPIRRIVAALAEGLPTFYLVFDDDAGLSVTDDFLAPAGEALRAATAVTILLLGQDRLALDPALWAARISAAISAGAGTLTEWQPFEAAVGAAINSGPAAPVLLLDHAGRLRGAGQIDIVVGPPGSETVHRATLETADGGDLQRAVARMHAADPAAMPLANLWGAAATLRLRPFAAGGPDFQIARLEDGQTASNEIGISPAQRHVAFTNLHGWFAAQFALPVGAATPPLARFTRGNLLTPLINGPAYFDDLFRALRDAQVPGGGLHLASWDLHPRVKFARRRHGDAQDLELSLERAAELLGADSTPMTLEQAADLIRAAGGASRFLGSQFFQIDPATSVDDAEIVAFYLLVTLLLTLKNTQAVRTNLAGVLVLMALIVANAIAVAEIFKSGGRPLEPNKEADEVLNALASTVFRMAPYPAEIADNPAAPPLIHFPWTGLFSAVRKFGIYHQKFAVVRTAAGHIGYCGGVDPNPNRLDDAHHLSSEPFHDVHMRVEGPAVRDLALSFEQRWQRDGGGAGLAFPTPAAADLGAPGASVVQVARTYLAPADPARQLDFAPQGDATLTQTMLAAIAAAEEFIYIEDQYFTPPQEYQDALVRKVWNGTRSEVRKLIIALPGLTDQPFGELARSQLISRLRDADTAAGGGVVQIGYPRRRFTVPDNSLSASFGKCILGEDLSGAAGAFNETIALGPRTRLPSPPFWVAVEGELMYVFDESTDPPPDAGTRRFRVDRGASTRLLAGGAAPKGPRVRTHKRGAAATVIELANIYVHAKLLIVDDVFLGVGSANLNRRGLFHDGEINVYTIPQALKAAAPNQIAALRCALWAEMLDLPASLAAPLLRDPLAAAPLFARSPLLGNRFVDIDAYPPHLVFGVSTGDGLVGMLLQGLVGAGVIIDHANLFNGVVDPTSRLQDSV